MMRLIRILSICSAAALSLAISGCLGKAPPAPSAVPMTQIEKPATAPVAQLPTPPEAKPMLDGTYSDMKTIPGEGDVIGMEITVKGSQNIPSVIFQCAQGELAQKQYVAAKLDGTTLRFKTRDNSQCPGASYVAQIVNDRISLSREPSNAPEAKPEVLKRVEKPGDRPKL